jgi:hypothetical protein
MYMPPTSQKRQTCRIPFQQTDKLRKFWLPENLCFHCILACLFAAVEWCVQVSPHITTDYRNMFPSSLKRWRCAKAVSKSRIFALPSGILVPRLQALCGMPVHHEGRCVQFRQTIPIHYKSWIVYHWFSKISSSIRCAFTNVFDLLC